jgi:membrane fusion protein (multidrug efflux system)
VVAVGVSALGLSCNPAPAPPQQQRQPQVYVTNVEQEDVPVYLDLAGQTQGFEDIEIRARVEGFLQSVNFREGSFVRKGDLLYTIDPKPFEAALTGARADVANEQAKLEKANNDVARYTPLVPQRAVSQQELDNARAMQEAARASVAAARAAVETARLNLGYTRVHSPIDGLIGSTQVKPGGLVGHNEATLLTVISRINPIVFRVGLTEAEYLKLAARNASTPGRQPRADNIELTLADGSVHPFPGKVGVVERQINPATGTLGVQINFPNPQFVLRPGQYGRARILVDTEKNALLVPQRAVQEVQNLYSVAVVDDSNKVTFHNVTVGPRVGDRWVIEKGLRPDERVVAEGLQSISDGTMVRTMPMPEPGTTTEPVATGGGGR